MDRYICKTAPIVFITLCVTWQLDRVLLYWKLADGDCLPYRQKQQVLALLNHWLDIIYIQMQSNDLFVSMQCAYSNIELKAVYPQ